MFASPVAPSFCLPPTPAAAALAAALLVQSLPVCPPVHLHLAHKTYALDPISRNDAFAACTHHTTNPLTNACVAAQQGTQVSHLFPVDTASPLPPLYPLSVSDSLTTVSFPFPRSTLTTCEDRPGTLWESLDGTPLNLPSEPRNTPQLPAIDAAQSHLSFEASVITSPSTSLQLTTYLRNSGHSVSNLQRYPQPPALWSASQVHSVPNALSDTTAAVHLFSNYVKTAYSGHPNATPHFKNSRTLGTHSSPVYRPEPRDVPPVTDTTHLVSLPARLAEHSIPSSHDPKLVFDVSKPVTAARHAPEHNFLAVGPTDSMSSRLGRTTPTHDVIQLISSPNTVSVTHQRDRLSRPRHTGAHTHPLLTISTPLANAETPASPSDEEHRLAEEAWQLVDKYFVSPSFNGLDWAAERKKLASASLPSRKATYAYLRSSFRLLSDQYTRLISPNDMNAFRRFDTSGVGLLLTTDSTGALVVATDPPAGSPAAKAGVVRGDVLEEVEGDPIQDQAAFSVSERMQGADGSDMHVTFRGKEEMTLRRSFPPAAGSAAIKAKLVDIEDGSKLGYIRLSEFRASSREEVALASDKLVKGGADWIVLDLRKNGGGVFEGALEIAGLFEGNDVPVAQVTGRADPSDDSSVKDETYRSRLVEGEKQVPGDVDVAVIIDGGSASSSEVLAGGLRDQCRAALVGERSYGKGLIQGVFGLSDGGGVVVTVGEYRTPNGDRIQGVGLKPDMQRRLSGIERIGRVLGVEKIDESTIGVEREQVREAVRMCAARGDGTP